MLLWLIGFSAFALVQGKVYERCELALELRDRFKFPEKQVATWVCIARHESEYNSSAVGGNTDHGLFQISDIYWCSPPGTGWACGVSCDKFEDDDISDDVECIRRIYNEHKRLSGDGFNAWTVYHQSCSEGRSAKYTKGCFDGKIITDKEEELTTEYNPEGVHDTYSAVGRVAYAFFCKRMAGKVSGRASALLWCGGEWAVKSSLLCPIPSAPEAAPTTLPAMRLQKNA